MVLAANARGRALRVPELITSRENRWLKQFRAALAGESLRGRGAADPETEIVGVEGPHLVETALRAGIPVSAVLVSESGARHLSELGEWIAEPTRLLATSDRLFAQIASTETPQGIAALVQPPRACFDDLVRGGVPLVLIMAGVQDPGNVGALLRAAEAFGAIGRGSVRGWWNRHCRSIRAQGPAGVGGLRAAVADLARRWRSRVADATTHGRSARVCHIARRLCRSSA